MKIHNLRLGFACNSSSSHSLIFLPGCTDNAERQDFGWQCFTLASPEAKMGYLGQQIVSSMQHQLGKDPAQALAMAITGVEIDADGYVDHQSVWTLPKTWDETSVDTDFLYALRDYLKRDGVVVLGGNDNDGDHPLAETDHETGDSKDFSIFGRWTEGRGRLIARHDEGLGTWTLFDRNSGAKVRLSFDAPDGPPNVPHVDVAKAAKPELVDVKVTDRCPYECEHCLDPETPVLTSDLTWKKLEQLNVGDELFAFEELPGEFAIRTRKTRRSTVVAITRTRKPAFKITTTSGKQIVASAEHRWLNGRAKWLRTDQLRVGSSFKSLDVRETSSPSDAYKRGYLAGATAGDGTARWERPSHLEKHQHSNRHWRLAVQSIPFLERVATYLSDLGVVAPPKRKFDEIGTWQINVRQLRSLSILREICEMPINETNARSEFARGWMAGFYDAEGCAGRVLRIAQKTHPEHIERAMLILEHHGFSVIRERDRDGNNVSVRAFGGIRTLAKFATTFEPATRAEKIAPWCFDVRFGSLFENEKIVSIERLGERELIDITTSERTFVADGFATHNCYQGSTHDAAHADRAFLDRLLDDLAEAQVFEVAYGGGEPTTYPNFIQLLLATRERNIVPNFTTRNLGWIQKFANELPKIVGRVAFSVDLPEEIDRLEQYLTQHKDYEKSVFSIRNGAYDSLVCIQHVVGAVPQAQFERLIELAKKHYIDVTLLGWKTTGRGTDVAPHKIDWRGAIERAKIYRIHIDTALARASDMSDIDKRTYHTTEGSVSCYVDGVQQKVGPSSYASSLVMRPYTSMNDDWKKIRVERGIAA